MHSTHKQLSHVLPQVEAEVVLDLEDLALPAAKGIVQRADHLPKDHRWQAAALCLLQQQDGVGVRNVHDGPDGARATLPGNL